MLCVLLVTGAAFGQKDLNRQSTTRHVCGQRRVILVSLGSSNLIVLISLDLTSEGSAMVRCALSPLPSHLRRKLTLQSHSPLAPTSGACSIQKSLLREKGGVTACSSGSRKTPRTEGGLRYIPTDYHPDAR